MREKDETAMNEPQRLVENDIISYVHESITQNKFSHFISIIYDLIANNSQKPFITRMQAERILKELRIPCDGVPAVVSYIDLCVIVKNNFGKVNSNRYLKDNAESQFLKMDQSEKENQEANLEELEILCTLNNLRQGRLDNAHLIFSRIKEENLIRTILRQSRQIRELKGKLNDMEQKLDIFVAQHIASKCVTASIENVDYDSGCNTDGSLSPYSLNSNDISCKATVEREQKPSPIGEPIERDRKNSSAEEPCAGSFLQESAKNKSSAKKFRQYQRFQEMKQNEEYFSSNSTLLANFRPKCQLKNVRQEVDLFKTDLNNDTSKSVGKGLKLNGLKNQHESNGNRKGSNASFNSVQMRNTNASPYHKLIHFEAEIIPDLVNVNNGTYRKGKEEMLKGSLLNNNSSKLLCEQKTEDEFDKSNLIKKNDDLKEDRIDKSLSLTGERPLRKLQLQRELSPVANDGQIFMKELKLKKLVTYNILPFSK